MEASVNSEGVTIAGDVEFIYINEGRNGRLNEIIGLQNAWNIMNASDVGISSVEVGVMDTAIYNMSNEIKGESEITGDETKNPASDRNGNVVDGGLTHGTMITHIIAADSRNGGISGIASILGNKMKVKVKNIYTVPDVYIGSDGSSYVVNDLVKIQMMVESGATVINCSFGPKNFGSNNRAMAAACKKFFEYMAKNFPKVIFVAAAGNGGNKQRTQGGLDGSNYWPGGFMLPNVITVGAIDYEGNRADFSNFALNGGEVTISAPGVNIPVGYGSDRKIIYASGTSLAAPQVTSAAAILKSINPYLKAEEIKNILISTASPGVAGKDRTVPLEQGMGSGVLNIEKAVLKVINDLRAKDGLSPLDETALLDLCKIDVKAEGGPKNFHITASLNKVSERPAVVKIELLGDGSIGGGSMKTLSSSGSVSWNVTLAKDSAKVRVTRLDSGG